MITFNCQQSGQVATANLEPDGSYAMRLNNRDGLPLGEYMVCIRPPLTVQQEGDPSKMHRNSLYDPSVSKDIPMRYRRESTSGLAAIVVKGDNQFNFDLSRKKNKK